MTDEFTECISKAVSTSVKGGPLYTRLKMLLKKQHELVSSPHISTHLTTGGCGLSNSRFPTFRKSSCKKSPQEERKFHPEVRSLSKPKLSKRETEKINISCL